MQLAGTRAYAQLSDRSQTARVIDLGYGGVGLEFNSMEDLSATFEAVLHVPILPPVRVNLKPLYQVRTSSGQQACRLRVRVLDGRYRACSPSN